MILFKVNKTYSETTPESASEGDFSDTGFVFENQIYTLEDLKDEIKRDGYTRHGNTNWFETEFQTVCYRTGTDRSESLHIEMIDSRLLESFIEDMFYGLIHYQDMSLTYNGETEEKTVKELTDRVLLHTDSHDWARLIPMIEGNDWKRVFELIATDSVIDISSISE